jgi:hypothetical protein
MLKNEKIVAPARDARFNHNPLNQIMKTVSRWYVSTVAHQQQNCLKPDRSFSVHILATAPKLSPAVVNVREKLKVE